MMYRGHFSYHVYTFLGLFWPKMAVFGLKTMSVLTPKKYCFTIVPTLETLCFSQRNKVFLP